MQRLRRDLREIESHTYRQARAGMADDEARLRRARQVLKVTGLDVALPCLVQELWHYGSWLNDPKQRWQGHVRLRVQDLKAEKLKSDIAEGVRVDFRLDADAPLYRFEWEKDTRPNYAPDSSHQFGVVRFYADGAHVLAVDMTHDLDSTREYWEWSTSTVTALNSGDWIAGVLELEHRIRMKRQQEQLEWNAKYVRDKAAGLSE